MQCSALGRPLVLRGDQRATNPRIRGGASSLGRRSIARVGLRLVFFPCLGCIRMDLRRAIKLLLTSKSCSRPIGQLLAPSLCRWLCKAPEPPHQVEVPFSFSCALCSLCVFVQPAPSANRGSALKSLVAQPRLIKCLRGRFAIAPPSRHPRHDH
uniref:Uncharacterized protein n=1 Tax=Bionectria ochroleuca TaxID=29856 RepID=A0A0B7JPB4_BIOOC